MSQWFRLERHGDRIAINLHDREITYAALASLADTAAGEFRSGDLAAVECEISLETLVAYLAAVRSGIPVLLVDAALAAPLRDELYRRYGVSVVFRARERAWTRRLASGPPLHPLLALLLSTSGSTGSPKLVRLSRRSLQANALSICSYLGIDERERAVTSLPFHYSFGLSVVHSHFLAGGALVLTANSVTERAFWERMQSGHATSLSGVPAAFEMLRRLRVGEMDLPSLRTLAQAGGRLASESVEWFAQVARTRGWRFFVMYGQTEAAPRMAYLPPELAEAHPQSIGVAIPGGRLAIENEDGREVDVAGISGELVYHGENVMLGYAESSADLSRGDDCGGRLHTGDIASRDSAGLHYLHGRRTRFIKVFGRRIGLDDVELALAADHDVVVTGRDDEIVIAGASEHEVRAAAVEVASRFHIHPTAIGTFMLAPIPRAASGKVLYPDIMAQYDRRNREA